MNKVGTIYKIGTFQLLKLSKLSFHFLSSIVNGYIFFGYPLQFPAHRGPEFIDQVIFPKKWTILYMFNQKKELQN